MKLPELEPLDFSRTAAMAKNFGGAFGGAIRSTIVAAGLIAAVVIYSDRSGRSPVALEAYVPHKGALFDMERRQVRARVRDSPERPPAWAPRSHGEGGEEACEQRLSRGCRQALDACLDVARARPAGPSADPTPRVRSSPR